MRTVMTTSPLYSRPMIPAIPSTGCTSTANGVISRLRTRLGSLVNTNTPVVPTAPNSRTLFAPMCALMEIPAMCSIICGTRMLYDSMLDGSLYIYDGTPGIIDQDSYCMMLKLSLCWRDRRCANASYFNGFLLLRQLPRFITVEPRFAVQPFQLDLPDLAPRLRSQ